MEPSTKLPRVLATRPPATPTPNTQDAIASTPVPQRTRVLCVDDAPDITALLARFLGREPDLEDAGALGSAEGIVDEVVRRRANVVVLDLGMPGPSAVDAIEAMAECTPAVRVIVYSGYDDPDMQAAVRRAGASDLVSKNAEPAELIRAIRRVAGTVSPGTGTWRR